MGQVADAPPQKSQMQRSGLFNDGRHHIDQLTDLVASLDLMPHGPSGVHFVSIAAPDLGPLDVAGALEFVDQGRNCPIGDANEFRQVSQSKARISCEADQDVAVVGQEGPRKWLRFVHHTYLVRPLRHGSGGYRRGVSDTSASAPAVIVSRRPAPGREAEFAEWAEGIRAMAAAFPGHVGSELQPPAEAHPEDWITVYRFDSQANLDRWLDSSQRASMMRIGDQLTDGATREQRVARPGGAVTAVMSQRILPEDIAGFRKAEAEIAAAMARFPGFISLEHSPPITGVQDDYVVSFTFGSRADLDHWLDSDSRRQVLRLVEPFIAGDRMLNVVGGFGGWFVAEKEQAPKQWKQALAVLIALYPTTLTLSLMQNRFFADVPWVPALFVSNVLGISALTWLLMPRLTSLLKGWLER